ncbi:hypothetical protein EJ08DRAFT_378144 [Tothia fuscella]|uniref:Uncharacterized protein n=1 Tax=Tothia fuscella TaxID=1048955 RepID=A0A9P4NLC5_9PEZI|nr:hypothetical protein EJ08DRAFT_378144 [Tothia fuscella]
MPKLTGHHLHDDKASGSRYHTTTHETYLRQTTTPFQAKSSPLDDIALEPHTATDQVYDLPPSSRPKIELFPSANSIPVRSPPRTSPGPHKRRSAETTSAARNGEEEIQLFQKEIAESERYILRADLESQLAARSGDSTPTDVMAKEGNDEEEDSTEPESSHDNTEESPIVEDSIQGTRFRFRGEAFNAETKDRPFLNNISIFLAVAPLILQKIQMKS